LPVFHSSCQLGKRPFAWRREIGIADHLDVGSHNDWREVARTGHAVQLHQVSGREPVLFSGANHINRCACILNGQLAGTLLIVMEDDTSQADWPRAFGLFGRQATNLLDR
jgi:hypothetical protein